jgi:CubicO group peptidase (beta-lactamase class C family)
MKTIDPGQVGVDEERLARIGPAMDGYVERGQLAGVTTLVARHGEVVHFHCCGHADAEADRPMAEDTIFRIYSMTKPITVVAALMLYEEGRFHLHDPINKYIPGFADLKVFCRSGSDGLELEPLCRPITFKDIFIHTSGLTYGFFGDDPVDALYQDTDLFNLDEPLSELINRLCDLPLLCQPGTRWNYSVSTDVLGYLVELIADMPLDAFFAKRIFEPLGMTSTGFYVPGDQVDRFSTVYGHDEEGHLMPTDSAASGRYTRPTARYSGGGGLVSDNADYLRFARMLLNNGELEGSRLLSRKTVEMMRTDHLPATLRPMRIGDYCFHGYGSGLGGAVLTDLGEFSSLGSVGTYRWSGAANTIFWIDPAEDLIGILMAQYMPSGTFPAEDDFEVLVYQALQ